MFKIYDASIDGVKIIETKHLADDRGMFCKYFCADEYKEHGIIADFKESYYSVSKKGAIRGMHFQAPPADHAKLVCVISGGILDVCVDIRVGSPTYGKVFSIELWDNVPKSVYIPSGFAHGVKALAENTCFYSLQTSCYDSGREMGIAYDSFGFDWGDGELIVSNKDKNQVALKDLVSPFIWSGK